MILSEVTKRTENQTPFTILEIEEKNNNPEDYLKEVEKYVIKPQPIARFSRELSALERKIYLFTSLSEPWFTQGKMLLHLLLGSTERGINNASFLSLYVVYNITDEDIESFLREMNKMKRDYQVRIVKNGRWSLIYYAPLNASPDVLEDLEESFTHSLSRP